MRPVPHAIPASAAAWRYSDVRLIDPVDSSRPDQDLLAVYLRPLENRGWGMAPARWQVRLDFLELAEKPTFDLILGMNHTPGDSPFPGAGLDLQSAFDTVLILQADGNQRFLTNVSPATIRAVRLVRYPDRATLEISFTLPQPAGLPFDLQVFVTRPGSQDILDQTTPIRSDGPPPAPAPVIFAFWNTYPAYTPVLALRRWDGAHTGPLGGRHGLGNLLRVAASREIPLFLLDLKSPVALAALDYTGQLDSVLAAHAERRIILADLHPGYPLPCILEGSLLLPKLAGRNLASEYRRIGHEFGLGNAAFAFSPWEKVPDDSAHPFQFNVTSPDEDPTTPVHQVWRTGGARRLTLSHSDRPQPQISTTGLEIEVREALVHAALSPEADLLTLGGDLPNTAWGNPALARAAFDEIRSRPWIRVLDGDGLLAFPASSGPAKPGLAAPQCPEPDYPAGAFVALERSGDQVPGKAASQALMSLFSPSDPAPSTLPQLKAPYTSQIGPFEAAARWAAESYQTADCDADLDFDSRPDCVLASSGGWALIDPETGALQFLFLRHEGEVHQVVGPTWQFATGLGPPEDWLLGAGLESDPQAQPGGFGWGQGADGSVTALQDDPPALLLSAPSGERITYTLNINVLQVKVESLNLYNPSLHLVLDPWQRFHPGGLESYQGEVEGNRLLWRLQDVQVRMESQTAFLFSPFNAARDFFDAPENPNRETPPGFFLPFPLAEVTFTPTHTLEVKLQLESLDSK